MLSPSSIEERREHLRLRFPDFSSVPIDLVRQVKLLAKSLQDSSNALLKPYGLTYPEFNFLIMTASYAQADCNPTELIATTGEKSANITRLTNVLCDKGLLSRSEDVKDRRRVALSLTTRGEALLDTLAPLINQLAQQQLAGFSEIEMENLMALLRRWHKQSG